MNHDARRGGKGRVGYGVRKEPGGGRLTSRSEDGCEVLAGGCALSSRLNPCRPALADLDGTNRSEYTVSRFLPLPGLFPPPPPPPPPLLPPCPVITTAAARKGCAESRGAGSSAIYTRHRAAVLLAFPLFFSRRVGAPNSFLQRHPHVLEFSCLSERNLSLLPRQLSLCVWWCGGAAGSFRTPLPRRCAVRMETRG